jgi:hypothetical protein
LLRCYSESLPAFERGAASLCRDAAEMQQFSRDLSELLHLSAAGRDAGEIQEICAAGRDAGRDAEEMQEISQIGEMQQFSCISRCRSLMQGEMQERCRRSLRSERCSSSPASLAADLSCRERCRRDAGDLSDRRDAGEMGCLLLPSLLSAASRDAQRKQ